MNTEGAHNYYITIREIKDGNISPSEDTDMINDEAMALCNKRSNLEKGDILFSGTGTIGETALVKEKPTNWNIKEGVYALKPKKDLILPAYLRYALISSVVRKLYMKKAYGGTVKSVSMKNLSEISIAVPPMKVQNTIVSILDKFSALASDLTAGLPAEIEARKKQYEYYRDKLLTFTPLAES